MELYLAEPRGFCAGVRRALTIVHDALNKYGTPIYVRHEIVHNKHIIEDLKEQGVIFIDELNEISDHTRPVIFSAHGVSQKIFEQARQMNLHFIDATCPLVNTVHRQIKEYEQKGLEIIVIGKTNHPEILGTVGQLKNVAKAYIVTTLADVENLPLRRDTKLGVVTQTTLSVEDTQEIVSALKQKFPSLAHCGHPNICFATTNRQTAIQKLVNQTPYILIVGSKNSSNSTHLREAALHYGASQAWLIDDVSEIDWSIVSVCPSIGISAGASAPDYLIDEIMEEFQHRYPNLNVHHVITAKETVFFK